MKLVWAPRVWMALELKKIRRIDRLYSLVLICGDRHEAVVKTGQHVWDE